MPAIVITIIIGLIGGIAVGLQSPFAGALSQRLGMASSSLIIHAGGALLSAAFLIVRGGENIGAWRGTPWYLFGAGALGVVLYATLSYTFPRVGAATAVTFIIVGQLVMGLLVDQFGLFGAALRPIDATRVLAGVLLLIGAYLMVR